MALILNQCQAVQAASNLCPAALGHTRLPNFPLSQQNPTSLASQGMSRLPPGMTSVVNPGSGSIKNNEITTNTNDNSHNYETRFGALHAGHITINLPPGPLQGPIDFRPPPVATPSKSGLDLLHEAWSPSALHNSSERFPPPRCHPGTRTEYLEPMLDWLCDTRGDQKNRRVLSLQGTMGAGKTAIAQTMAESAAEFCLLAASFFFSRDSTERKSCRRFVPTIAAQLCKNVPDLSPFIESAVVKDPSILQRTIQTQFQFLVVEPFIELLESLEDPQSLPDRLILIDGIDECEGEANQRCIINLVLQTVEMHALPLRFLLVSRPQPHIQETFSQSTSSPFVFKLTLLVTESTLKDIRMYVTAAFAAIVQKFSGRITFPPNWPGEEAISYLVTKSKGNFIHPATVLKYIDVEALNPIEQLKVIMRIESPTAASSGPLDEPELVPTSNANGPSLSRSDTRLSRRISVRPPRHNPKRTQTAPSIPLIIISDDEDEEEVEEEEQRVLEAPLDFLDETDALYYGILSSAKIDAVGLQIIGLILVLPNSTAARMEAILGLQKGDVMYRVRMLRSIIHIPADQTSDLAVLHASFSAFITDRTRARQFYIDIQEIHAEIVLGSLKVIQDHIDDEELHSADSEEAVIFTSCIEGWMMHIFQVKPTPEFVARLISYRLADILHETAHYGHITTQKGRKGFPSRLDVLYLWFSMHKDQFELETWLDLHMLCSHILFKVYGPALDNLSQRQLDIFTRLSAIHSSVPTWPPTPLVQNLLCMKEVEIMDLITPSQDLLINGFFTTLNATNKIVAAFLEAILHKISQKASHAQLAVVCLQLLNDESRTTGSPGRHSGSNGRPMPRRSNTIESISEADAGPTTALEYAKKFWAYHINCSAPNDLLFDLVADVTDHLLPVSTDEQKGDVFIWLLGNEQVRLADPRRHENLVQQWAP